MTVWALIAAYNEAAHIGDVVARVRPHVAGVLVVDDGSTDATADTAAAAGASVIRHESNLGKGRAIRTGLAAVLDRGPSHVLLLDGDLQHDPDEAPRLIEAARQGAVALVIGERQFERERMPASRYYTNTISSWVISRFFTGIEIADAQCGYRVFSADLLRRLRLSATGYEIETEMLIKAARRGARIARVPIRSTYTTAASKLRPLRDTTRTCFLAVRYRFFPEHLQ